MNNNKDNCIEENNGKALVHVGGEKKKFSLNECQTKSYAEGDIVRVDGKLAILIMRKPPNHFLFLVGNIKKELTLENDCLVPFDPRKLEHFDDSEHPRTPRIEWKVSFRLSKAERRKRAADYQNEFGIEQTHAFAVVDGKMSLKEAREIKKRKEKRRAEIELLKFGVSQDIIGSYLADNITYEEAISFEKDRLKNPDLVGSTEDYYDNAVRLGGSFGSASN